MLTGPPEGGERSEPSDLGEFELDRSLTPEDVDEHLDLELILVDLDDLAGEVGEGPSFTRTVSPIEYSNMGLDFLDCSCLRSASTPRVLDILATHRRGLAALVDEAGDTRVLRITYQASSSSTVRQRR